MHWVGTNTAFSKSIRLNSKRMLAIACLFASVATQHISAAPNPELIQALQQETHDRHTNTTDLAALVWLSSMSANLEKRIPNHFYRIRLLSSIYQESKAQGLDPQLVLALIEVESNFNRNALSHAGAQGLMQVMPFWKKEIGQTSDDLFNPLTSIKYGCQILRHYFDRYPDANEALAAYNGSRGRDTYPNKVMKRLKRSWQYSDDSLNSRELKWANNDLQDNDKSVGAIP